MLLLPLLLPDEEEDVVSVGLEEARMCGGNCIAWLAGKDCR